MNNTILQLLVGILISVLLLACNKDDDEVFSSMGYANVLDYGAEPGGDRDNSGAFKAAAETGKSIYVPHGVYYISEPIILHNQNMFGDGMFQTEIISASNIKTDAIVRMGRTSSMWDLSISFAEKLITGNEVEGERIGIRAGSGRQWGSLQRGSQINRVKVTNVGTAVYTSGMSDEGNGCFSVVFDNMELSDFSFRGVDFQVTTRTGNVFRNIYMNSNFTVDCLFNFDGEESETIIEQLNLEHTKVLRAAISFRGARNFNILSMHIEGIILETDNSSFIYLENSSGKMDAVTMYYTAIDGANCSMIKVGDAVYRMTNPSKQFDSLSRLFISTLHLKGMHTPHEPIHGSRPGLKDVKNFTFFERETDAEGDYTVYLDNYVYYTFRDDLAKYQDLTVKGNISLVEKF